jgi:hypothetical protein
MESISPLQLRQEWPKKGNTGIHTLPDIHNLLSRLYTIAEYDGDVQEFFADKRILTSLHITTRNHFDYVFFLPVRSVKEQQTVTELLKEFQNQKRYTVQTRTFQEHRITEVSQQASGLSFSFFLHDNHLIASYTPFLIEDVIRNINKSLSLQKNTWTAISDKL